jgi:hypothetical protein
MNDFARRSAGAAVGGAIGVAAYWLMLRSAYCMPGVAGIGLALGVSTAARSRSIVWGLVTAVLAAVLSVAADWWFRPFLDDPSLSFYLRHLHDLSSLTLVSLLVAPVLGFYFGRGRAPKRLTPAA